MILLEIFSGVYSASLNGPNETSIFEIAMSVFTLLKPKRKEFVTIGMLLR